jgi:hypothetical protein
VYSWNKASAAQSTTLIDPIIKEQATVGAGELGSCGLHADDGGKALQICRYLALD